MRCPQCDKEFPKERGLNVHIMRMHSGREPWSNRKKSKRGIIAKNRVRLEDLGITCPVCDQTYANRSVLGAHVRHVHHKSLFEFPPYKKARFSALTSVKRRVRATSTEGGTGEPASVYWQQYKRQSREFIALVLDIADTIKKREEV